MMMMASASSTGSATASNKNKNSNKQSSTSTYVSSRALDNYGNLVQVRHAYEAAQRHGRLVVAAVVQPHRRPEASQSSMPTVSPSFIVVVSIGTTPIVQPIQLPVQPQEGLVSSVKQLPLIAMCCTGVRGDARWLTHEIQRYLTTKVWQRYGTDGIEFGTGVAYSISKLMTRFVGHDESDEWQSSIGVPAPVRDPYGRGRANHQNTWSRPFGVRTMVLSTGRSLFNLDDTSDIQQVEQEQPPILLVDPSGRILVPEVTDSFGSISLAAMGKDSERVEQRLVELFKSADDSSDNESGWSLLSPSSSSASSTATSPSSWKEKSPTLDACKQALIDIIMEEVVLDMDTSSSSSSSGNYRNGRLFTNPFGGMSSHSSRMKKMMNKKLEGLVDGNLIVETFSTDDGLLTYQKIPFKSWVDKYRS